jgi:hypothetical protein
MRALKIVPIMWTASRHRNHVVNFRRLGMFRPAHTLKCWLLADLANPFIAFENCVDVNGFIWYAVITSTPSTITADRSQHLIALASATWAKDHATTTHRSEIFLARLTRAWNEPTRSVFLTSKSDAAICRAETLEVLACGKLLLTPLTHLSMSAAIAAIASKILLV